VRGKRISMWLERLLLTVGCACMAYYGYITLGARQFQREQTAAFEARPAASASARSEVPASSGETSPKRPAGREGGPAAPAASAAPVAPAAPNTPIPPVTPALAAMVGILEIPRLNISSPVMSGDDTRTLDRAVGHLPDTPKPWESGNSAVAAHRDGLFRPLKNIKIGDDLRIRTAHGEFTYQVRELKIVSPKDLSVLQPTADDMLTLITCYPFNYIGPAPKRFIVRAARMPNPTGL
jgi:LPXTG-site transpeptidase (sortase) family protein